MADIGPPPIIHITHWKAGSQWIHKILHWCAPGRVISPDSAPAPYPPFNLERNTIYATAYLTKNEFEKTHSFEDARYFVVLRDLRDTLISLYYSVRDSHSIRNQESSDLRYEIKSLPLEDGLLAIARHATFLKSIEIHRSWLSSNTLIVKYEDLLENDEKILEQVLLTHCGLRVSREHLLNSVRGCRFETLTGRPRGMEDTQAHERKGISGDWKNNFTKKIIEHFEQYDDLLTAYRNARSVLPLMTEPNAMISDYNDSTSQDLESAKAVLQLTLSERRRWLNAYREHHALDGAALTHVITLQSAVDAAVRAVADETSRLAANRT